MGFFGASTILLAVGLLATGISAVPCFIKDFDAGEVLVMTKMGAAADLKVAITATSQAFTDYIQIAANEPTNAEKTDNYIKGCDEFNICTVHVGLLLDISFRMEIKDDTTGNLKLHIRETDNSDPIAMVAHCAINGVNIKVADHEAGTLPALSELSGFVANRDGGEQPYLGQAATVEVNQINHYDPSGGVVFGYSGSGSVHVFGSGSGTLGVAQTVNASEVSKIETYAEGNSAGNLCGVKLFDDTNAELAAFDTCSSQFLTGRYSVPDDYRLLGFAGLYLNTNKDSFTVIPLLYQRLRPRVLYYQRVDEELKFTVKSFFALTGDVTYSYTYPIGLTASGGLDETGSVNDEALNSLSTSQPSSDDFTFTRSNSDSDTSCGCYYVDVDVSTDVDTNTDKFKYADGPANFKAWTVGFSSSPVVFGTHATQKVKYSGSAYITYSENHNCPEMYHPLKVATGSSKEMWIDGWISSFIASGEWYPASTEDIDAPITKVYIHADGNNYPVGMTFTTASSTNFSTGDVSFDVATNGVLEAPSDNHYLMYIKASYNPNAASNQLSIRGISAVFGRPKAPCYVMTTAAEDYSSDLPNGDMRKVHWYAPVDFTKVTAHMNGKFVAQNGEYMEAKVIPVNGASEFERGNIYSAYFYHMKPNQDYTFNLTGTHQQDSMTLVTDNSDSDTFTTGNGLYLDCTNVDAPEYTHKIDWSAIPEVQIQYKHPAMTPLGGSDDHPGHDAKSAQMFPQDEYFHYLDNVDPPHPAFDEFRGYPKKIYLYFKTGQKCARDIGLEYDLKTGPEVIKLTKALYSDGDLDVTREFSLTDPIKAVRYSKHSDGCLNALQFTYKDDSLTACEVDADSNVGNNGNCGTTMDQPDDKFYMTSLNIKYDDDGYITALGASWASVDIPTLKSHNDECELTKNEDPFDIRRTYWNLTYELEAGNTDCGVIYSTPTDTPGVHNLVYDQTVRRLRDNAATVLDGENGAKISRSNAWEVTTKCTYHADGNVTSEFATKGEEGKTAWDRDSIEFQMYLYKDHTFTEKYDSPPTLNLGEQVYVSTELDSDLDDYVLKNFQCYATKTDDADASERYVLSGADGCRDDDSFQWDDLSDPHKDAFQFESFGWYDGSVVQTVAVHLHCTVKVCPDEHSSICDARNDGSCGAKRARRDVSELVADGVKEKTVSLDTPIFVRRRAAESLNINRDPVTIYNDRSMTVTSLFGLFATVAFFCLLVIAHRVHTMRKGYYQLKNEVDFTAN